MMPGYRSINGEKSKMSMKDYMTRDSRTLKYQGAILDIYEDVMRFPDGKTEHWDYVAHRMGAAAVLPVLPDGRLVLVRQYRPAIEMETLEIPAGCRDSAEEDWKACAARELEEETGYSSDSLSYLLTCASAVAYCNEQVRVYLAENLKPGKENPDEHENIRVEIWSMDELIPLIRSGQIRDSKTIAALMTYAATQKKAGN